MMTSKADSRCSLRCIQVIAGVLGRAGEEGQARRFALARLGRKTSQQFHGLQAPSTEETAGTPVGEGELTPEAKAARRQQNLEKNRLVTSISPDGSRTPQDDDKDAQLMNIFHMADFTDFEDPAPFAALQDTMSDPERTEDGELAELRDTMRKARKAARLDPDSGNMINIENLGRQDGREVEELAKAIMDDHLTPEEAAAIHTQPGGESVQVQDRWRDVLRLREQAEDPQLTKLIAQKRRDMGEDLSDIDEATLQKFREQSKAISVNTARATTPTSDAIRGRDGAQDIEDDQEGPEELEMDTTGMTEDEITAQLDELAASGYERVAEEEVEGTATAFAEVETSQIEDRAAPPSDSSAEQTDGKRD